MTEAPVHAAHVSAPRRATLWAPAGVAAGLVGVAAGRAAVA